MKDKIKLSGLESFLMRIADQLRKSMDESEYKEYIFGLLFLKRMSDVFEEKQEQVRKDYKHLPLEAQEAILEQKSTYGETFFVPKRARWNTGWHDEENDKDVPALRDLHENIGPMLNKALTAIEESNSDVLQGIFKDRINFNKMSVDGTPVVKNADLRKLIEEFNNFPPLLNRNFEFPDLLGAAYEFILKYFADNSGKKGGEFYTPNTVVRMLVKLLQVDEGMSVYDPTVGSGGMLIQSYQFVEDEGKNPQDLALYGQDNKDGVVAICKMNMIFHDIFGSHIKLGDVLANPQHTKNGRIMTFDRVIANPPFSQNYTTEEMKYKDRFCYGFLPENAKKADLMFVQHMLASCKDDGRVVVVMPHGVLFRGKKEKEIRTALLQPDVDVLEGVISLPPQLFYGTGIPACVMVFAKRKSDDMKHKVFFINADREYKEGKKQNTLRPEDIEKISYVYLNKMKVDNYSRLVDLSEIAANDYTLNIRKYVDNTPAPEKHDVHAHLVGGVPSTEIDSIKSGLADKIQYDVATIFEGDPTKQKYCDFAINKKEQIKDSVEGSDNVNAIIANMHSCLAEWWKVASQEFATLAGNKDARLPKVRTNLMLTMKAALEPLGMLDQHQVAGIFVNWWDGVKYDLKTIIQRGWDVDLIFPESSDLVVSAFFGQEASEIKATNDEISGIETKIEELVENALEAIDYEPEEPEDGEEAKEVKHTSKLALEQLAIALSECSDDDSDEKASLETMINGIKSSENALKESKARLSQQEEQLSLKVEIKCLGNEEKKNYVLGLLEQTKSEISELTGQAVDALDRANCLFDGSIDCTSMSTINESLDNIKSSIPSSKKQRTAEDEAKLAKINVAKKALKAVQKQYDKLQKEVGKMTGIIQMYDDLLASIGGKITEEETRDLILQKHYCIIAQQLDRYVDGEKRDVISALEHLHDKYSVSAKELSADRDKIMGELNGILKNLHYID